LIDILGQQLGNLCGPVWRHSFQIQGGVSLLDFVFESEIEAGDVAEHAMAQDDFRFAGIVVAVVIEEDNLAPDLRLQTPRGVQFGK
jgi:hypothetical protein